MELLLPVSCSLMGILRAGDGSPLSNQVDANFCSTSDMVDDVLFRNLLLHISYALPSGRGA
jgi:hypothetical protein